MVVTCALPYANGALHLGHLLEYIQADIWVRFQRLQGRNLLFVCADDAHGTPIMLKAEEKGISPEQLVAEIAPQHLTDMQGFDISFDNFHSTHSEENRLLCNHFYERLGKAGLLATVQSRQFYDEERKMFLADRMVTGDCPSCAAAEQYGDVCESCGATYDALQLQNPVSSLSGKEPSVRSTENIVLRLELLEERVRAWLDRSQIQQAVRAKLNEWLNEGLKDWTITRPAPYFGFPVPDDAGKYFYVWLDAPIGYLASLQNLLDRRGEKLEDWWNDDTELCHFIGKDIIYFHTLFWPAMLAGADFSQPDAVFVHGFLTINGTKMSKSRGTLVAASHYLKLLPPDPLRYYLAARLGSGVDDLDLDLDDFVQRVNSDLVGKFVNLASRTAGFMEKGWNGALTTPDSNSPLANVRAAAEPLANHYQAREYNAAMRQIMALADDTNRYIQELKPWELARTDPQDAAIAAGCSAVLGIFRILTIYLKPCVPRLAQQCEQLFGGDELHWKNIGDEIKGMQLEPFSPLMTRLEQGQVKQLVPPD